MFSGHPSLNVFCACAAIAWAVWWSFARKEGTPNVSKLEDSFVQTGLQERTQKEIAIPPVVPTTTFTSYVASFFSCCEGRVENGVAKHAGVSVASAAPWLDGPGLTHPRFCGLRMREPSLSLPTYDAFRTDVSDKINQDHLQHQLDMSLEERKGCQELKASVVSVPGPKDAITILQFLRARNGNVELAKAMYASSMKWREDTQWLYGFQNGTIDDKLHRRADDYVKPFGIIGRDFDGDPCVYVRTGRIDAATLSKCPTAFLVEHEVYQLTRMIQARDELNATEGGRPRFLFTVIEDLQGLGLSHFRMRILQNFKATTRIGEDHFPEILKRVIVVNAPPITANFWVIVKHFFDKGTRDKINIVSAAGTQKAIFQHVDPKWVPESLGGSLRVGSNPECEPVIPLGGPMPESIMQDIMKIYGPS